MQNIPQITPPDITGDRPITFGIGDDLVGVIGKICDYTGELHTSELAQLDRAIDKRRIEYATGRHFARIGLTSMGYPASAIRTGEFRRPQWPRGIIGSITHSSALALVVVARLNRPFLGIGIDMEKMCDFSPDLLPSILTERELSNLKENEAFQSIDSTMVFSAKESVYKAVNPITNFMIDFTEAEIHVDSSNSTFRANYVGKNPTNRVMNHGCGSYSLFNDQIISFFGIP